MHCFVNGFEACSSAFKFAHVSKRIRYNTFPIEARPEYDMLSQQPHKLFVWGPVRESLFVIARPPSRYQRTWKAPRRSLDVSIAHITMASDLYSRSFDIAVTPHRKVTILIAEPNVSAEGLGLTTWTSSDVLLRLIPTLAGITILAGIEVDVRDIETRPGTIPVLELGAGTGLCGITAAITWNCSVILTDLEPIVPSLAQNIALNKSLFADATGVAQAHLSCGSLDWRDPSSLNIYRTGATHEKTGETPSKANIILAADTVYSEEHPELLSKTILAWLAPGSTSRAIICYALRVAYLDHIRELWQMLEAGGLEAIAEGQDRAVEKEQAWDDETLCEWCIWQWKQQ